MMAHNHLVEPMSGNGRELGRFGLEDFLEYKSRQL